MERLIEGDEGVVTDYRTALSLWSEIFRKPESGTVEGLAGILWGEQGNFERQCGGRYVGQEIMVASGIYQFYTTAVGFEGNLDRARLVANAFRASMCSMELKYYTDKIAEELALFEE